MKQRSKERKKERKKERDGHVERKGKIEGTESDKKRRERKTERGTWTIKPVSKK